MYIKLPTAERRSIILPVDRAETHLDVYFYIIFTPSSSFSRRDTPDFPDDDDDDDAKKGKSVKTRALLQGPFAP